jgi:hypothetical protein
VFTDIYLTGYDNIDYFSAMKIKDIDNDGDNDIV